LRREQDTLIRYLYNTKVNFKKFLERPDDKQSIVTAFQEEYNQIEDDLRYRKKSILFDSLLIKIGTYFYKYYSVIINYILLKKKLLIINFIYIIKYLYIYI